MFSRCETAALRVSLCFWKFAVWIAGFGVGIRRNLFGFGFWFVSLALALKLGLLWLGGFVVGSIWIILLPGRLRVLIVWIYLVWFVGLFDLVFWICVWFGVVSLATWNWLCLLYLVDFWFLWIYVDFGFCGVCIFLTLWICVWIVVSVFMNFGSGVYCLDGEILVVLLVFGFGFWILILWFWTLWFWVWGWFTRFTLMSCWFDVDCLLVICDVLVVCCGIIFCLIFELWGLTYCYSVDCVGLCIVIVLLYLLCFFVCCFVLGKLFVVELCLFT